MEKFSTVRSLVKALAGYGNQLAVLAFHQEGDEQWSYTELATQVQQLACGLVKAGIQPGNHVAVLARNQPAWIVACLATMQAGAVVVPLDIQFDDKALGHVLHDSGVQLVFTTADMVDRLQRCATRTPLQPYLLDAGTHDARGWQQLMTDRGGDLPQVEPADGAALFYTSGTTGPPKGVPLCHGHLAFQLNALLEAALVRRTDCILLPLPLHHVYPFVIGMLGALALGLPLVLPHALTGPQIVRALREGQVTVIIGVPRLYSALYTAITAQAGSRGWITAALFKAAAGLSTFLRRRLGLCLGKLLLHSLHQQFAPQLRLLASGGAALDPELAWKLAGLGWQIATGYGLTETAPLLTWNLPGRTKMDSAGRPLPGVDIRIAPAAPADESESGIVSQTEASHGQGEIVARGPNVFSGYHNLPDKSAEAFTADGWFRTGDLGYFDSDGYLHVLGRQSTLIVTDSGENIQPEDIEAAYLASPFIREAGVLQHHRQLVAVIVPDIGAVHRHRAGDIEAAVRAAVTEQSERLPSYQRVSHYVLTREPLPRTRLGKIRRHLLAQRYEQGQRDEDRSDATAARPMSVEEMSPEDRAMLEHGAAQQVWEWLSSRYADQRLTLDTSPQLDLGIDSLAWLHLSLEIGQRTGVELNEEAIGRIDTIRDLLREVSERAADTTATSPVSPLEHPEAVLTPRQKRWLKPLGAAMSALRWGLYVLNRGLMHGLFRLRVQGLEYLPDQGQIVLAPNHVSYLDPFALAAALDFRRLRQTYWGGWTGVAFRNPLYRFVSRLAQTVPIDPTQAVRSSLAFGAAVLQQQQSLVWFPEGQRSPTGTLQPFKAGLGMLLAHFRVPVVPVYIHGTYTALPPHKTWPRLRPITVVFGKPLHWRDLEQQGTGDQPHERIVAALHNHVAALGQAL